MQEIKTTDALTSRGSPDVVNPGLVTWYHDDFTLKPPFNSDFDIRAFKFSASDPVGPRHVKTAKQRLNNSKQHPSVGISI